MCVEAPKVGSANLVRRALPPEHLYTCVVGRLSDTIDCGVDVSRYERNKEWSSLLIDSLSEDRRFLLWIHCLFSMIKAY
jgi:hypothetical protein